MVRLDDVCLARARTRRLDDVRVDRALSEELHTGDFMRLLVKHVHERAADDLALRLRIRNSCQRRKEARFRIGAYDTNAEMLGERTHHLVALAEAQQPMIDEDAHELIADRAVQWRRHDR